MDDDGLGKPLLGRESLSTEDIDLVSQVHSVRIYTAH